jgi:hypothetical protein
VQILLTYSPKNPSKKSSKHLSNLSEKLAKKILNIIIMAPLELSTKPDCFFGLAIEAPRTPQGGSDLKNKSVSFSVFILEYDV